MVIDKNKNSNVDSMINLPPNGNRYKENVKKRMIAHKDASQDDVLYKEQWIINHRILKITIQKKISVDSKYKSRYVTYPEQLLLQID